MLKKFLTLITFILFSNFGYTQDIPTVDDINKSQPKLPVEKEILPSDQLEFDQSQKLEKKAGEILKILVTDFEFDGNLYYSNEELKEVIKEAINTELGYDQLIDVTRAISNHYRASGFLATAFLPPQDINNGVIKVKITEAMLGTIIFEIDEGKKLNLPKENIRLKLLYKIEENGVLNIDQLDKNVRNLNKIPGINALAQLEEGNNFGETNVKVTAINTETIFGNTLVDNNGSRSSGYNKITNTINVDGLFDMGDRLTFTNVLSGDHHKKDNHEESNYYAYNLSLNRPLIESPNFNLNTSFSLANNKYVNDLSTGNNSDKDVLKSVFNLGFDNRDSRFGGGINYGSFGLSLAKVDLTDNSSNYDTDQSTSDNNGRNFKGTLNLNRMQKLTDNTNMLIKFNGQLAADNLDGADQLSLGGPNAVRAYPSNEAAGDLGFVASLELKRNLFKNLESTLFYDYGKIKLHKSLWDNWNSTNTALKNNYHLQGYGASVGVPIFQNFNINASYARKISANSGRDSSGNDVDGLSWNDRGLISINGKFWWNIFILLYL